MMRLAIALGAFLALVAATVDARAEKRVALIVGNAAYQNASALANPGNDANAMAELFRKAGFDVVEARRDLGNLEFKRVVREFTALAREADIAVMYFAGHGIEVNGVNYLLPVDAKLASDFDVEDEALSLDRLVRALEPAKRLRLIILDACRDNPFVRTMQRSVTTRAVAAGLAKVEPATSDTLIAFATKPGATADDGRGANSPFTAALLNNLMTPGRDVRIALGYVRDEVVRSTGAKQEPFVSGSLGGATVALVAQPKREIAVLPAPPPAADPRRDYEFAERVGTREAWDSFLAVHPSGFYADLARAQRDKLAARSGPPAAPTVPPPPPPAETKSERVIEAKADPRVEPRADAKDESEPKPDLRAIARDLQIELKRVGCDPGRVDGTWSSKSVQALARFNRLAGGQHDVKVASLGALEAVKSQQARICPPVCGARERVEGDRCVAIPVEPKAKSRKEAARPPAASPREKARERARERVQEKRVSRPAPRASCPPGSSPFPQGGRMCCESTPEGRGAPRVFCP